MIECVIRWTMKNETHTHDLPSTTHDELEQTIRYLYMIFYPILFLVGLVGNVLSSLLFSITDLSHSSCAIYFILLAVSNTLALIGGLHHCLTIGYDVLVRNAVYCRVRNLLLYTAMDEASWMIVALSLDRLFRVKCPMRARIYCTRKLTIIVCSICTAILVLKNAHLSTVFIGDLSNDTDDHCNPNPNYPGYVFFFRTIWPWIDLTTFALLPFMIVTLSDSLIIYDRYKSGLKFGHRNLDRSLVKFLLISSLTFIFCNFPFAITIALYPYISSTHAKDDRYDQAAFMFDFLRLFSYASLALTFYLYYYSSSIFRQQAIHLCQRICRCMRSPWETSLDQNSQNPLFRGREQLTLAEASPR